MRGPPAAECGADRFGGRGGSRSPDGKIGVGTIGASPRFALSSRTVILRSAPGRADPGAATSQRGRCLQKKVRRRGQDLDGAPGSRKPGRVGRLACTAESDIRPTWRRSQHLRAKTPEARRLPYERTAGKDWEQVPQRFSESGFAPGRGSEVTAWGGGGGGGGWVGLGGWETRKKKKKKGGPAAGEGRQ